MPHVAAIRQTYGTWQNLLTVYSPRNQYEVTADVTQIYLSNSPRLEDIDAALGKGTAVIVLGAHLKDLSEKCSLNGKLSTEQIEDLAKTIIAIYPKLRLTEFIRFLVEFKGGKHGKFYNAASVTEALNAFWEKRNQIVGELLAEQQRAAKAKADALHDAEAITKEEYLKRCEARGIDPYKPYDAK